MFLLTTEKEERVVGEGGFRCILSRWGLTALFRSFFWAGHAARRALIDDVACLLEKHFSSYVWLCQNAHRLTSVRLDSFRTSAFS